MKKGYILSFLWLFTTVLFAISPITPSSNLKIGSLQGNSISVNFTKGNGASRIGILKMGSPISVLPQNGNSYLANATFGVGQELARGEFVVYAGSASSFTITNLVPETDYYLSVFEYNGSGLSSEFLVDSFLADTLTTLSAPSLQPSGFLASEITGNTMTISWSAGDGDSRIVLAKQGAPVNANPVELISYRAYERVEYRGSNSGAVIGDNNFVVYKGSGTSVNLTEMNPDTTYHFAVFEFNGSSGPVYLTTEPLRASVKTLPNPTKPSSDIVFSAIEGDRMTLRWTNGNGTRRIVVVREGASIVDLPQKNNRYVASPYFDQAEELAPGHKVVYDGVGNSLTVQHLKHDSMYYFAVFEYSGSGNRLGYLTSEYPENYQNTQTIPTSNVSNIDTVSVSAYSAYLKLTPGTGSGRLIVMRKDSMPDFVPDNYKKYNFNSTYGSGYGHVGNKNYLVYNGSGSNFYVGLQPNSTYFIKAYEYNGLNNPIYVLNDVDTFSFTTKLPPPPKESSRNLSFSGLEGNSMRLIWTSGDGERRIVIARKGFPVTAVPENGVQYEGNKVFAQATEIEAGQKVIYDGTGYYADFDSLEMATQYYFKVIEYNGTGDITSYLLDQTLGGTASTASAPTISSRDIQFKLLSLDKLRIIWTLGNGGRRLILGRKNAPVDGVPENLKQYSASTYFGGGSKIGESSVVMSYTYSGKIGDKYTDTVFTDISSMEPGNTYNFKVFEYNGNSAPVYKHVDPAEGSFKITFEPPTPASGFYSPSADGNTLALHWTKGGGDKRIIIAREGEPVDIVPQDGVDYMENNDFRLAEEIAPGQKVVYDGSNYFTYPEGLNPNTHYYFKIFEYGGTAADIDYLTSVYDSTDVVTKAAPTIQASNLVVSGITPESGIVSWTNGDGEKRLVVARKDFPVSIDPSDTTTYNSNYFGSGSHLGDGNYVVYKNNGSNFQFLKLLGGTTYHLAVYEFNGNAGPVLLRPPATAQFTTLGPPQNNAIVGISDNITTNSFHINFTRGSGQKRLVIMREGNPVDAEPLDNINYTDNTFLGAGDEIGTGNFVVYDGEDDNMVITGLNPGTNYYFTVFEYNAFNGGTIINYLRPSTAIDTVRTESLNSAPVLNEIGNKVIDEENELSFTVIALDLDDPEQTLTYRLDEASHSLGMTIDSLSGAFSWTPTVYQGGVEYPVTVTVTDDGKNPSVLSDSETFIITVNNVLAVSLEELNAFNVGTYPNPFKQQFTMEFVSPLNAKVRIDFYDISGHLVKTIFNQNAENGMKYKAIFEPTSDSGGIYFYRISVGEKVYFGKVIRSK